MYIKHRQEACVGWYEDKCLLLMLKEYVLEGEIKEAWGFEATFFWSLWKAQENQFNVNIFVFIVPNLYADWLK